MIKSLPLLFIISLLFVLSESALDKGPCNKNDMRLFKNKGTGLNLALQQLRVINSHIKQLWCISDESSSTKTIVKSGNADHQQVVFYAQNSEYVMTVLFQQIQNANIGLVPSTTDVGVSGQWDLVYQAASSSYSVRTRLENTDNLVLAAVSTNPIDGLTLKPFDANDALQQWTVEVFKRKGEN